MLEFTAVSSRVFTFLTHILWLTHVWLMSDSLLTHVVRFSLRRCALLWSSWMYDHVFTRFCACGELDPNLTCFWPISDPMVGLTNLCFYICATYDYKHHAHIDNARVSNLKGIKCRLFFCCTLSDDPRKTSLMCADHICKTRCFQKQKLMSESALRNSHK